MIWSHTWGKKLPTLLQMEEATGITPKALRDMPEMWGLEQEMITAYNILASTRAIGLTVNAIQLQEIQAYLQLYGPPTIPIDVFVQLISAMSAKSLEVSSGHKPSG